jgi:hypothetical protein
MRKRLAYFGALLAFLGFGFLGFMASPASADCAATPTAELCSEEVTTSLVGDFMSVISGNVLLVTGLVALAVAIPIVIRLVTSAARKIRA